MTHSSTLPGALVFLDELLPNFSLGTYCQTLYNPRRKQRNNPRREPSSFLYFSNTLMKLPVSILFFHNGNGSDYLQERLIGHLCRDDFHRVGTHLTLLMIACSTFCSYISASCLMFLFPSGLSSHMLSFF